MSERRRQFLQKLLDLYNRTNVPVHYETLAQALGVSKWTSYDMLKELEKLGYLIRDYIVRPGETGRSHLVYRPTAKTANLFGQGGSGSPDPEQWLDIKEKALALRNRFLVLSTGEAVRKMLEEAPGLVAQEEAQEEARVQQAEPKPARKRGQMVRVNGSAVTVPKPAPEERISFCAQMIGLLLGCLHRLEDRTKVWIKSVVRSAPTAEMRATVFVGTVLGAILQAMPQASAAETGKEMAGDEKGENETGERGSAAGEVRSRAARLAGTYMRAVHDLSEREKGLLSDFLTEALA